MELDRVEREGEEKEEKSRNYCSLNVIAVREYKNLTGTCDEHSMARIVITHSIKFPQRTSFSSNFFK